MKTLVFTVLTVTLLCIPTNVWADAFGTDTNQFEIEFVTIGDPGNKGDRSGVPRFAGAVDYVYSIGKHEVSRNMIEKASADGGLELTLNSMDSITGGPRPDMAATGVSWNEAARFVNWLNASQGFPMAYKFSAQPGDVDYHPNTNIELWEPTDFGFDRDNRFRNSQARYALPSMDEWYKAAFYDPNLLDGAGDYWNYTTGSYDPPLPVSSGTDPYTAVHSQRNAQGPADITQAGGLSAYGVMALGGNVWEWEETDFDLVNDDPGAIRAARGGRWISLPGHLKVYDRDDDDLPTYELDSLGFRVVSIPEPSSQVDFEVSPGVGKFQQDGEDDPILIVEEIENGRRIKVFQSGTEDGAVPQLSASWSAEEGRWYRFDAEIKSVSVSNGAIDSQDVVADLKASDRISFGTHVLPPDPETGSYSFAWQFNPSEADFGDVSLTWEFTAVPIDPPLAGDMNGDGTVGLIDFLVLVEQFNSEDAGWSGGDFNLDGTTDILDFLILHNNFGSTVEYSAGLAAVPEPSSLLLIAFGVFALPSVRRKRCGGATLR